MAAFGNMIANGQVATRVKADARASVLPDDYISQEAFLQALRVSPYRRRTPEAWAIRLDQYINYTGIITLDGNFWVSPRDRSIAYDLGPEMEYLTSLITDDRYAYDYTGYDDAIRESGFVFVRLYGYRDSAEVDIFCYAAMEDEQAVTLDVILMSLGKITTIHYSPAYAYATEIKVWGGPASRREFWEALYKQNDLRPPSFYPTDLPSPHPGTGSHWFRHGHSHHHDHLTSAGGGPRVGPSGPRFEEPPAYVSVAITDKIRLVGLQSNLDDWAVGSRSAWLLYDGSLYEVSYAGHERKSEEILNLCRAAGVPIDDTLREMDAWSQDSLAQLLILTKACRVSYYAPRPERQADIACNVFYPLSNEQFYKLKAVYATREDNSMFLRRESWRPGEPSENCSAASWREVVACLRELDVLPNVSGFMLQPDDMPEPTGADLQATEHWMHRHLGPHSPTLATDLITPGMAVDPNRLSEPPQDLSEAIVSEMAQHSKLSNPDFWLDESRSGWLLPDGTMYEVPYAHHEEASQDILLECRRRGLPIDKTLKALQVIPAFSTELYDVLILTRGARVSYWAATDDIDMNVDALYPLTTDQYTVIRDLFRLSDNTTCFVHRAAWRPGTERAACSGKVWREVAQCFRDLGIMPSVYAFALAPGEDAPSPDMQQAIVGYDHLNARGATADQNCVCHSLHRQLEARLGYNGPMTVLEPATLLNNRRDLTTGWTLTTVNNWVYAVQTADLEDAISDSPQYISSAKFREANPDAAGWPHWTENAQPVVARGQIDRAKLLRLTFHEYVDKVSTNVRDFYGMCVSLFIDADGNVYQAAADHEATASRIMHEWDPSNYDEEGDSFAVADLCRSLHLQRVTVSADLDSPRYIERTVSLGVDVYDDITYAQVRAIKALADNAIGGNLYIALNDRTKGRYITATSWKDFVAQSRERDVIPIGMAMTDEGQEGAGQSIEADMARAYAVDPSLWEQKAIEVFGITSAPTSAGFLLKDGRWLDFGSRHWANWIGKEREHADIGNAIDPDLRDDEVYDPDRYGYIDRFLEQTGAIRWGYATYANIDIAPNLYIQLLTSPTERQRQVIRQFGRGAMFSIEYGDWQSPDYYATNIENARVSDIDELLDKVDLAISDKERYGQAIAIGAAIAPPDFVSCVTTIPSVVTDMDLATESPCLRIELDNGRSVVYSPGIERTVGR